MCGTQLFVLIRSLVPNSRTAEFGLQLFQIQLQIVTTLLAVIMNLRALYLLLLLCIPSIVVYSVYEAQIASPPPVAHSLYSNLLGVNWATCSATHVLNGCCCSSYRKQ